ncbi:MAG: ankyrin repeat domain-containing protein [Terracidiphilus sp.]|jgi:ankyrin repeat protein
MSAELLKSIQRGQTAEVEAAVAAEPALARWRDSQDVSALLWAVYCGQGPVRDFLRARLKAEDIALDIFEAAATGDESRLREILEAEPEAVHAYSGDGWTPLHLAAAFGTPVAVAALLECGARVDAVSRNAQQNQPLHAALALGRNAETIELLLAQGADANAAQAGGFTAIFSAAVANRRDLAELLVAHGADAGQKSDQGKTPADFARERGHAEMAGWLETQVVRS